MPATVLRCKDGTWRFLVTPLTGSETTHVVSVDKFSGALCFDPKTDVFPSVAEARESVIPDGEAREEVKCSAVVGYVAAATEAALLVVTQAEDTARLPGWPREHVVRTVVASRWIRIPLVDVMLQFSASQDAAEDRSPSAEGLSPPDASPSLSPVEDQPASPPPSALVPEPGQGAAEDPDRSRRRVRTGDQRRDRELLSLQVLSEMQLDGHHFWCDTFDLTNHWLDRPCGDEVGAGRIREVSTSSNSHKATKQQPEQDGSNQPLWEAASSDYVWNARLSEPFRDVGLQFCCVVLLRGLCCSNVLSQTGTGHDVVCTLVTRQRNLNPGSRYEARGLHAYQGPGVGNEYECEQILYHRLVEAPDEHSNWSRPEGMLQLPKSSVGRAKGKTEVSDEPDALWSWAYYCWARGTVPLRWSQALRRGTDVTATISMDPEPYQGVVDYWQHVWDRYGTDAWCVMNLLRNNLPGHVGVSQAPDYCTYESAYTPSGSPRHTNSGSPVPSPRHRQSVDPAQFAAALEAAGVEREPGTPGSGDPSFNSPPVQLQAPPEADSAGAVVESLLTGVAPVLSGTEGLAVAESICRRLIAAEEGGGRQAHGAWLLARPMGRGTCEHSGWLEKAEAGWARRRTGKSTTRLWFELISHTPPVLRYHAVPGGPELSKVPLARGAASAAVAVPAEGEFGLPTMPSSGSVLTATAPPPTFPFSVTSVTSGRKTWYLSASSPEERQEWMSKLGGVISVARERCRKLGIDIAENDKMRGIERGYGKGMTRQGEDEEAWQDDDYDDEDMVVVEAEDADPGDRRAAGDADDVDGEVQNSSMLPADSAVARFSTSASTVPRPLRAPGARRSDGAAHQTVLVEQGVSYKAEPLLGYWFENSLHALDRYLERQQQPAAASPLPQSVHVPGDPPQYHRTEIRHMDWHGSMKKNGEKRTVEMLWRECAPKIRDFGVSSGLYYPQKTEGANTSARQRVDRLQRGVFRFNCADSLDRTNLGCFTASLHALTEQFRALATATELSEPDAGAYSTPTVRPPSEGLAGDEWCLLSAKDPEAALKEVSGPLLSAHAASFVCNGDVCALAYCNSPAMHSGLLRSYAGDQLQAKGQSNFSIALKRRYANQFTDRRRTRSISMFLGRNWGSLLPTAEPALRIPRFGPADAKCAIVLIDASQDGSGAPKGARLPASKKEVAELLGGQDGVSSLLFNGSRQPFYSMYRGASAPPRPLALIRFGTAAQAEEAAARLASGSSSVVFLAVSTADYVKYYERWWDWLQHKEEGAGQRARQIFTDVRTGLGNVLGKGWKAAQRWRK